MAFSSIVSNVSQLHIQNTEKHRKIWDAAQNLEASFLAEMLKGAGLGETSSAFGGGQGEEQFASFLREAQAKKMVNAGGVGLSQVFYDTLKELDNV